MKLFSGLDIETTGVDQNKCHRLIQIGIVLPNEEKRVYDVLPEGDIMIQSDALGVNHFTLKRIGEAPPTSVVDHALDEWISSFGYKHSELTPVGWNVGGFDMSFIKKELPLTAAYFTYRTMDLTAAAIMHELVTGKSYRDTKAWMATETAAILGREKRHDALYDAEAALVALKLFRDLSWDTSHLTKMALGTS